MFTSIRLRNFKSYRDSGEIPLRPLTLIVGRNNAGKSTIFDAILALKQTAQDRSPQAVLITSGPFVDLGGFQDIIHGGRAAGNQTVSLSLTISSDDRPDIDIAVTRKPPRQRKAPKEQRPSVNQTLAVSFAFDERANRVRVQRAEMYDGREPVLAVRPAGLGWTAAGVSPESRKHFEVSFSHFFPVLRAYGKEPPDKVSVVREILNLVLKSQAYAQAWEAVLDKVRHIAPVRSPVPWFGVTGRVQASELGPGGENLLRVMASAEHAPDSKKSLRELVNEWLCERFGMLRKLHLVQIDKAGTLVSLVGDEEGMRGINVAAMGEGISQLLPIVARVSLAKAGECLLIEQPELHLHPAAQADLGDLFAENLRRSPRRQCIIETHSEHLLLRLRRRIADGTINPESIAILFVEKRRGESRVRSLELNKYGHFDEWPEGFFEEGYKEALHLAEEGAQRRQRSR